MKKQNKVFIATSIDGYIADKDSKIDWLQSIPNPEGDDMGYSEFTSQIDALVMGRNTFETVCNFDIEWPYEKPVFVLSNRMKSIPKKHIGKAELINGNLKDVLSKIHSKGHSQLYIDGGKTIQAFLEEDLIDEMTITIIPVLLGGGILLFNNLDKKLEFECINSKVYLRKIVQNKFIRKR